MSSKTASSLVNTYSGSSATLDSITVNGEVDGYMESSGSLIGTSTNKLTFTNSKSKVKGSYYMCPCASDNCDGVSCDYPEENVSVADYSSDSVHCYLDPTK